MKYYQTQTQEDYNDLMNFLEERGFIWFSDDKPTYLDEWDNHKEDTVISIYEQIKKIGFAGKANLLRYRGIEESDIIVWGNEEAKDYLERLINEEEKEESNV